MLALVLLSLAQAPPTVRTPKGEVAATSAWCAKCHDEAATGFRASRHSRARTNAIYVANHAQEPMRWCDGCHAPLGAGEDGIGCASCHVRDGAVLAPRHASAAALREHATEVFDGLSDERACERCHQVAFPAGKAEPVTLSKFPMQNTVEEWRASGASRTCVGCHMPEGTHRITGGHDLERVQRALEAQVSALGEAELKLTLRNRAAAHSVPTGDPFRQLELELCVDDDCERVVARHRFGRTIERAGETWAITRDWTVPAKTEAGPGERSFDVAWPEQARAWRLSLRYVGDATVPLLPPALVSMELFRGRLPARAVR